MLADAFERKYKKRRVQERFPARVTSIVGLNLLLCGSRYVKKSFSF